MRPSGPNVLPCSPAELCSCAGSQQSSSFLTKFQKKKQLYGVLQLYFFPSITAQTSLKGTARCRYGWMMHRGAKKSAGVKLRDKSLANTQRKDQRRRQKALIEHLDGLLPPDAKSQATINGVGERAIGLSGRSLHNVLHDAVEHLHALRRQAAHLTPDRAQSYVGSSSGTGLQSPDDEAAAPVVGPMDAHMHRCGIVSSRSLAAIELSMPGRSISRLNLGYRCMHLSAAHV